MIFDVPPLSPYIIIEGQSEYMGWACPQKSSIIDTTDYLCSQMAIHFPSKTFIRIKIGHYIKFAIKHKCTKLGDIFRVTPGIFYFWDINSSKFQLLGSMRCLAPRNMSLHQPFYRICRNPISGNLTYVNGVKVKILNQTQTNNQSTIRSGEDRSTEKSDKDKLQIGGHDFDELSIAQTSTEEKLPQLKIIGDRMYNNMLSRKESRYLPYITQINSESTLTNSQILPENRKSPIKRPEETREKMEPFSDENPLKNK